MALPNLKDDHPYISDFVYQDTRQKDAETAARHLEQAKKALERRRARAKGNA